MKKLLEFLVSLFVKKVPMHIIIGSDPNFKLPKTNLIWDFFRRLLAPDDWVHRLQIDRLMYRSYWESHPECFALVDGARIPDQLCLTNPLTLTAAGVILKVNIMTNPGYNYWSVSQGDNSKWCQCPECSKRSASHVLIAFVNEIARENPTKTISTLAYYGTEKPGIIQPLSNVQIMYTTIQIPKDKPLETSDRADVVEWRNNLYGWLKMVRPDQLLIWDYTCNFRHLLVPFPIIYQLCENLQWYARLGIKNFLIQNNSGPGHEFSELKSFLIAELMNNPKQDYKKLISTFLQDYYGPAAPYIQGYIDYMYAEVQNPAVDHVINWYDPSEYRTTFLSDEVLDNANEFIYSGWKAVLGNPTLTLRVETVHLQILYTCIELGIADENQIDSFKNICSALQAVGQIVTVNESNQIWSDYIKMKGL